MDIYWKIQQNSFSFHSVQTSCGVHQISIKNIIAAFPRPACAHTHTHNCREVATVWILPLTFSFRLNMHQATSTPSHVFTKQHLIKHRDFTLTFSETGTGQDLCGLAVSLTLRFTLLLADKHNSTCLYKHNNRNHKNMIQCTLKYLHLRQLVHMQCCYHATKNTSPWAHSMAAGCTDFPLWYHEQYQTVFWAV